MAPGTVSMIRILMAVGMLRYFQRKHMIEYRLRQEYIFIDEIFFVAENVWNLYDYVTGMKSKETKFQAMISNNHPNMSDDSLCTNDMDIQLNACVKSLAVLKLNFSDHVICSCL